MKIVACILYEEGKTINPELAIESVYKYVEEIIIIDGTQNGVKSSIASIDKVRIIKSSYEHEKTGANGIQRNKYLDYLKKNHLGKWALVLDADECLSLNISLKDFKTALEVNQYEVYDVLMEHFINNLNKVDNTVLQHLVPRRLFKVTKDLHYTKQEHSILEGFKNEKHGKTADIMLWHFGYAEDLFKLKYKFQTHMVKSKIHSKDYLIDWYHRHLLGEYPTRPFPVERLPEIIKKHFLIDEDYLYFKNRGVEHKHAECVRQWNEYFKPDSVLDIGCGRGPYLRYWEMCVENSYGIEISKWAIGNKLCNTKIYKDDIVKCNKEYEYSLVTCIDILEHLELDDLPKALENIYNKGKQFLFSIPFLGDPNLEADPTHKIKRPKLWWLRQLETAGFKIKETPQHWYFKEQLIVAEK